MTIPVRYFIFNEDECDIEETTELEWLKSDWPIEYQRQSIAENGVNQITLTKMPVF